LGVTRRNFLKISLGTLVAGSATTTGGAEERLPDLRNAVATRQVTSVCPYCAVGCGIVLGMDKGKVVHVEGDRDHPINQGSLCLKGQALPQLANSPYRVTKVRYRAPGAGTWEEKEWDWAVAEIVKRAKATRDRTFTSRNDRGLVVNRTESIASLGGAALDNEECYLVDKLMRALGIVYLEQQARL
jgi:formate dehydrogenase major subunit